jgi:hypothetical protein
LRRFVSRLKTPRNEVIVFHLMGVEELLLSYNGAYTFQDLETGRSIKVDTVVQQKQYAARVQEWIRETRMWMLEKQINYYLVQMDASFEQVLRDFLKIRKTLAR